MTPSKATCQVDVSGVVQGVGFRPFVFSLAQKYQLKGQVTNTSNGVKIIAHGAKADMNAFCRQIRENPPPLAQVTEIKITEIKITSSRKQTFSEFQIVKSEETGTPNTLISPDVSICPDCLEELNDPADHRFGYPFINCTNCGPRFTIIEDIPYDRPKTSMKHFPMCPKCSKEYQDPGNRRFHAQPNACPVCGPHVFLTTSNGQVLQETSDHAISEAAKLLRAGHILGIKGLGGFHLACDAANPQAVAALREKKMRPHKPFALMAASVEAISGHVAVNDVEKKLLESVARPIVLLKKKKFSRTLNPVCDQVSPLNSSLGIMLPYTPLHYLLLQKGPDILVMTSGNRSGEPLSIENEDAVEAFCHIADYFLMHNRDIYFRADDSIVKVQAQKARFFRRSRGYAPMPVTLDSAMPNILGLGAGMKNTVCISKKNQVFISQHIGDLESVKTQDYFAASIDHMERIFDIEPFIAAHDLHTGYASTKYAKNLADMEAIAVQHHHAHAVSCMAENHLDHPVLAVTLDGTGLGTDGHIWGGEILLCTLADFKRKAHLKYLPMPGGDKAVLEPWRMAVSWLYQVFGSDFINLGIPFLHSRDPKPMALLVKMVDQQLNSPLTSSTGRLFDAAAAIMEIRDQITYESQAAMELEAFAVKALDVMTGKAFDLKAYGFDIHNKKDAEKEELLEIDMAQCLKGLVSDIQNGLGSSVMALKFHITLIDAFCAALETISAVEKIKDVVLSGGVFCNSIVFEKMIERLETKGFTVYTHTQVPCSDGGICLGQTAIAAAQKEGRT